YGIGSFLVNRVNSNKILIGPGGFKDNNGDGSIYRTHNQGQTWHARNLPKHNPGRITRIVDDRSDPTGNHVMVATSAGIYRSIDFGKTWNPVYEGAEVTDLVQDTSDPTIWYAAAMIPNVIIRSVTNGITWSPYSPGTDKITGS